MTTERPPSTPLWINYRFVHVRDWNTSSLLEILFCLLWQKPWLVVQSEQEPQIHQYLLMKSLPFINRNLISRRLLIARHVRETLGDSAPSPSEKLTGLLQWQGTAAWGIRSCVGPTSGLYRPCWRTWDLHKGPWWRIMMSWHACWTVLPCEGHLDLWGRAAVMRGLGEPTLGLDFIQTQPPDCWVTQACPLTSLAITFIPYIKRDYIFSCWTHSDHIAICCLFGQMSPQTSLGSCSGSDDSLLSLRPPAQYWACPRHSINEWMGSGGFLQPLHSLPTPPHCPYAGHSLFQRDLGPSPLWFSRTAGSTPVVLGLLSTPPQIWFNSTSLLWTILQPREDPREWDRVLEAGRKDREKGQRREGEGCVAPCSL